MTYTAYRLFSRHLSHECMPTLRSCLKKPREFACKSRGIKPLAHGPKPKSAVAHNPRTSNYLPNLLCFFSAVGFSYQLVGSPSDKEGVSILTKAEFSLKIPFFCWSVVPLNGILVSYTKRMVCEKVPKIP